MAVKVIFNIPVLKIGSVIKFDYKNKKDAMETYIGVVTEIMASVNNTYLDILVEEKGEANLIRNIPLNGLNYEFFNGKIVFEN